MAQKLGRDYLRRSARNQGMLKSCATKDKQRRAKEVLFHKFIKVHPNYKFYKFHATLIQQLQKVIDGE